MICKHAHTADVRRLVKTFQGLLEIACRQGHDVCLLMAGAILPCRTRAEATDECLLPAAILAQDLVALRVRPRKGSSASLVSGRLPPLGGRRSPVSDDVLAS